MKSKKNYTPEEKEALWRFMINHPSVSLECWEVNEAIGNSRFYTVNGELRCKFDSVPLCNLVWLPTVLKYIGTDEIALLTKAAKKGN